MAVYSMTGFASASAGPRAASETAGAADNLAGRPATSASASLNIELRSVNNRFLDVSFRLPDEFRARPIPVDDKAKAQLAAAKPLIGALVQALSHTTWDSPSLEAAVRAFAEAQALNLGQAAQPLRAALTGSTASPPIFEVMAVLGRTESLARLADAAAV